MHQKFFANPLKVLQWFLSVRAELSWERPSELGGVAQELSEVPQILLRWFLSVSAGRSWEELSGGCDGVPQEPIEFP